MPASLSLGRRRALTDPAAPKEGLPKGALWDTANGTVPPSLTNAWGELCAVENKIPDGLSVGDFVCADEDVVVLEELTDEAIIRNVCEANDPDDSQRTKQLEKTMSPQDVLNALDTIRSFFGERDDDVAMDLLLQCKSTAVKLLRGKARQSKLTDFWQ